MKRSRDTQAVPKVTVEVQRRTSTSITLTEEQAAEILAAHFNAPAGARVDFDCGHDFLRGVTVGWEITEVEQS